MLLTDKGKELVTTHAASCNAHKLYQELLAHSKQSAAANVEIEHLDDFLKNSCLDNTWKGNTAGYIAHWQMQMCAFESLADANDLPTDGAKKCMLSKAVAGVPNLAFIRDTDEIVTSMAANVVGAGSIGTSATPCTARMNYEQYCTALSAACTRYDNKHRQAARCNCARATNMHQLDYDPLHLHVNVHTANYVDDSDTFVDDGLADPVDLSVYSTMRPQEVFAAAQQCLGQPP